MAVLTALPNSPVSPPKLKSRDYVQDRVRRILKTEVVPEQFVDNGQLGAWHNLVRAHAFEELLHQMQPDVTFTVQCLPFERWEPAPGGKGQQFIVGCELHYTVERK